MKKIVPFILLVFVLSCSKSEDDTPDNALTTSYIELDNVVSESLIISLILTDTRKRYHLKDASARIDELLHGE